MARPGISFFAITRIFIVSKEKENAQIIFKQDDFNRAWYSGGVQSWADRRGSAFQG